MKKVFRSAEDISSRAKANLEVLKAAQSEAYNRRDAHDALLQEYDRLTVDLQNLVNDMELLNLASDVQGKKLNDLAEKMEVMASRTIEDCELDEDFRQEMAQIVTLMTNFQVFLNDPGELAALLKDVDPGVREKALRILEGNN
jgi:hypothetical protein